MKQKENRELLWQLFKETGDPLCWMLYRRGGDKTVKGAEKPSLK